MSVTVWRHSGRGDMGRESTSWRRVECDDPVATYKALRVAMRQGRVELRDAEGNVIDATFAPRLRTRW